MRVATALRHAALLLSLGTAIACESDLRPLVPGTDACGYCRMTIDDVRFGALVKTAKGRLETFDSIECAASYVATLAPTLAPGSSTATAREPIATSVRSRAMASP